MEKKGTKISRDIRRDQIVGAALGIIARSGVKGLTTAAIAREVGVSEANLYRHFRNKDEILYETVRNIGEGLLRNLENVFRLTASPLMSLKRIFMFHLDYIEKNEGIPRLMFSEEIHMGNEELKKKLLGSIVTYAARLEGLIREGQKAGAIRCDLNPRAAALTLIGMVQVTAMRWSLSGFSFPLVDEGMKLWETYKKCISV